MDTIAYFNAKQELIKFLEENPRMAEFQEALDLRLKTVTDPQVRMRIIQLAMTEKLEELAKAFNGLADIIDRAPKV